jgi:hypothetical protein
MEIVIVILATLFGVAIATNKFENEFENEK